MRSPASSVLAQTKANFLIFHTIISSDELRGGRITQEKPPKGKVACYRQSTTNNDDGQKSSLCRPHLYDKAIQVLYDLIKSCNAGWYAGTALHNAWHAGAA